MLPAMTSQRVRRDLATEQPEGQIRGSWGLVLQQTFWGKRPSSARSRAADGSALLHPLPGECPAPRLITCSISPCKRGPQKNALQGPRRNRPGLEGAGRYEAILSRCGSSGAASSPCLQLLPGRIRPRHRPWPGVHPPTR